jgi:hypothetical protein
LSGAGTLSSHLMSPSAHPGRMRTSSSAPVFALSHRYHIFKVFESNLTLATDNTPCPEQFTPHYTNCERVELRPTLRPCDAVCARSAALLTVSLVWTPCVRAAWQTRAPSRTALGRSRARSTCTRPDRLRDLFGTSVDALSAAREPPTAFSQNVMMLVRFVSDGATYREELRGVAPH